MPASARSRRALVLALLGAGLAGAPAQAQRATEQFIPIGRSPGLSAAETTIGRIEAVDPAAGTLVVEGREVVVVEATRIWLDRSADGRSNVVGSLADCRPGHVVEVRLAPAGERPEAAWIKVKVAGPTP